MKLTEKDIEFLNNLRVIMQKHDLWVERRGSRLVLRKNYGDCIEQSFKMTRQGVRWRFQRVADMYRSAFETILKIEQTLGSELRTLVIEASKHQDDQRAPIYSQQETARGESND